MSTGSWPLNKPIRVLITDDSPLLRQLLSKVIGDEDGFNVVGTASDGGEAADLAKTLRPDIITMDLDMPKVDGFQGIARIMSDAPTPILVLSGNKSEAAAFKALSHGALDIMEKPDPSADLEMFGRQVRGRLRLLAAVKVIRHLRGRKDVKATPEPRTQTRPELVVIGASLGGPRALASLLRPLPRNFKLPLVIVQHIAEGFTEGLAKWLAMETDLEVKEAQDGDPLTPGVALVGPSGHHLLVGDGQVHLNDAPPIDTFKPAVSPLFRSAARYYGKRAAAVILTGMGHDGADGMKLLHEAGAHTIAQDEASCIVFGMPKAAIDAGAIDRVLSLDEIPKALLELAG
jgi:two-component system chemotaxis response regulator CheB